MGNIKGNTGSLQKTGNPLHSMPTFGDIMKNIDKPSQETDKKEFVSRIVGKISQAADEDFSPQMPSFDLGRNILAQQRKVAALKRKSPVQINDTENIQSVSVKPLPIPVMDAPASPQQKVIADIIAKEIRLLTAGR